jgi:2-oxoglutarate ferredoxin oxidoreductase subunit alpha
MNELLGLAYYAEIPVVLVDVQRVGPSTGMPTRTQQGDVMAAAYASHGDTKHILVFPANPAECFDMAPAVFDLAEKFQTPVFMMTDLDIGMNDWVVPRLKWTGTYEPNRGTVLNAEQLAKVAKYQRYNNWDADFVAARTLPGVASKGAFFTRGSGHNKFGGYTETPDEYQEVTDRLLKKHKAAAKYVPAPLIKKREGSRFGIVTIGGCDAAVQEAVEILAARGIVADFMRIRGFPFDERVENFLMSHSFNFIVEQNRDAQLKTLLTLETNVPKDRLRSILVYGGFPLSARHVIEPIAGQVEPVMPHAVTGADHVRKVISDSWE